MKLTLHKSQVHSYSVSDGLAIHSCLSLPAEASCESRERIVLQLSLLRNNTVAKNPLRFTLYYGSSSALTFRDFVPRLELLTLFRDFLGI